VSTTDPRANAQTIRIQSQTAPAVNVSCNPPHQPSDCV